jgi:predicted kinase
MHAVLILGAPGVGKTTLVEGLSRVCPRKNAFIDADHVAYTNTGGTDKDRLDLIENNLFHCIRGFKNWGARYVFCAWITEHQHRLDAFVRRLASEGVYARTIVLTAPCDETVERIRKRRPPRFDFKPESVAHLKSLSTRLNQLTACTHVDTAGNTPHEVLNQTRRIVSTKEYWER